LQHGSFQRPNSVELSASDLKMEDNDHVMALEEYEDADQDPEDNNMRVRRISDAHYDLSEYNLLAEMENDQGSPEHALERSVIRANQNQNFDGGFCTLANLLGACEKINKTPIPLVYTRHAERFLLLWLLAVPPTLCSAFGGGVGLLSGAGVVFGTGLISILLFGVDELAIQLEEPFGVLPLDAMCKVIEGSVNDMVRVNHEEL